MSAFVIDLTPYIVSGTLDNSIKGTVSGNLVIHGLDEPVEINLNGNSRPDLAGCILKFQNPRPRPIEPDMIEYVLPEQSGCVDTITAAGRGESLIDGQWTVACQLTIEWLNFQILTPFIIMTSDYKLDIDLPRWSMTELEIGLQKKEIKAARTVFREMYQEYEEDCIESELAEERHQIITSILPQLELAETDGERISLLREALGADLDVHELEEYIGVYCGPEESFEELPKAPPTPTITLDEELKALGSRVDESTKLLLYRAEGDEAPSKVLKMGEEISLTMCQLLYSSTLLDPNPDAPQIEPHSAIRRLENLSVQTKEVISYLELEGSIREKQFCEPVWKLLEEIGELVRTLKQKVPDDFPPEKLRDDDIPF